ncbi:MAG: hypothetical protein OEU46_11740, partial [Alphaproteobacteria bacterium]|nr:hypothetical protein [Alphaproteobacteria bacterium]
RVTPRVLIDNKASNRHTVIEVNGRDRPGLLYAVTGAFYDLSLQVYAAKISTYGEQVVDVFYVKDVFGLKIEHPAKLDQIRGRLLEALNDPGCKPAKQARVRRRAATKPSLDAADGKPKAAAGKGKSKVEAAE